MSKNSFINRKSFFLLILLSVLQAFTIKLLAQTTYFIDATGGSDSNNGTTSGTAWKTITKVNATSFVPDDIINFKRGEVWRETLVPKTSGTSGHYIHFTSYGTGNKPKILGSDSELIGWTLYSGNVWYKSMASAPQEMYFIKSGGASHRGYLQTSTANCNGDYKYYHTGGNLYVYATSDPNGYYTAIEKASRQYGISFSTDYVWIDSLEISYPYRTGIVLEQADYAKITNNEIHHIGKRFNNDGNRGITFYAIGGLFSHNKIYECSYSGITLNPGYNQNASYNIIEYNEVYNCYHVKIGIVRDPSSVNIPNGNIIRYNTVYDINPEGSGAATPVNKGMGIEVFGNSSSTGTELFVKNTRVYGNLVYNVKETAYYFPRFVDSIYVYNNMAYGATFQGFYFGKDATQTTSGHAWIYNNISSQNTYEPINFEDVTDKVVDYNLYYPTKGFPFNSANLSTYNIGTNLTTWQALGFDTHGVLGNPLFTNTATYDFSLQSGSPARNTGTNLVNSVPYFYTEDILGATVPTTTTTDMGAYESYDENAIVDSVVPNLSSASIINPTTIELTFSEALEINSTLNKSNYFINNGIAVNSVSLSTDSKKVTLSTTQNTANQIYTVVVNNVKDLAGNIISSIKNSTQYSYVGDSTPPEIASASLTNPTTLVVNFSEAMDPASSVVLSKYVIGNGITISSASLSADGKKVTLNTSQHTANQNYTVTISNVIDLAGNTILSTKNSAQYSYIGDTTPPNLLSAAVVNPTTVELSFSEGLESVSAQTKSNYSIDNGITVNSATLSTDKKKITLSTNQHIISQNYTVTVANVKDLAGNNISTNNSIQYPFVNSTVGNLKANVKIFLQGPYQNNNMITALSDNEFIPVSQPYNVAPWLYNGSESLGTSSSSRVDWVLVELRSAQNPTQVISRRAGLLRSDGRIMEANGTLGITFNNILYGSYYIAIFHRNHLAVMTATSVLFSPDNTLYDFSTAFTKAYGQNALTEISTGVFGMFAGDGDGNGTINDIDRNQIWSNQNGNMGYLNGDFNLDSGVTVKDINDFWNLNEGKVTQVP